MKTPVFRSASSQYERESCNDASHKLSAKAKWGAQEISLGMDRERPP